MTYPTFHAGAWLPRSMTALALFLFFTPTAFAQFTTVINVPPDLAPTSIGSNTQLNLSGTGMLPAQFEVGMFDPPSENSQLNVTGGVAEKIIVRSGGEANISGGAIGERMQVDDGGVVNLSGDADVSVMGETGSQVNISGGEIFLLASGNAKISGGNILLDVLEGGVANVSGGIVDDFLRIDPTAVLNVSGGVISAYDRRFSSLSNLEVFGTIDMSDGRIDGQGSAGALRIGFEISGNEVTRSNEGEQTFNLSGGVVTRQVEGNDISTISMSGGSVAEISTEGALNLSGGYIVGSVNLAIFGGQETGQLEIIGNDFQIDGQPVDIDSTGRPVLGDLPDGAEFTGIYADGTPFFYPASLLTQTEDTTLTHVTLPAIGPALIDSATDAVPIAIREGQTLRLADGTQHEQVVLAVAGSRVEIETGAVLDNLLRARGSDVDIQGGEVERIEASHGANIQLAGGHIGTLNLSDGDLVMTGGVAESINANSGARASITGGVFGQGNRAISVTDGGQLLIAGGTFEGYLIATAGSTVDISGTEFLVDGTAIANLALGEPMTLTDRNVTLSGRLADGSVFSFDLNTAFNLRRDLFDPAATLRLTLVPEPGSLLLLGGAVCVLCFRRKIPHSPSSSRNNLRQLAWAVTIISLTSTTALAQITTIINVPPDVAPRTVGPNTQVNLSGQGVLRDSLRIEPTSLVNMTGGVIEGPSSFSALSMTELFGTLNMSGGRIEGRGLPHALRIGFEISGNIVTRSNEGEQTFMLSGGVVERDVRGNDISTIDMSGGSSGPIETAGLLRLSGGYINRFATVPPRQRPIEVTGGRLEISANDFQIDGQPLEIDAAGRPLLGDLRDDAEFSGIYADGTPFFYEASILTLAEDTVLNRVTLPAIGPALINSASDPVPIAIREGQTLRLANGTQHEQVILAVAGSRVEVEPGAELSYLLDSRGAEIDLVGGDVALVYASHASEIKLADGQVDRLVLRDARLTMTGGVIGTPPIDEFGGSSEILFAESGSQVTISGGSIASYLFASAGSEVELVGTEFLLDGEPISGVALGQSLVLSQRGGKLTGRLMDGSPFDFQLNTEVFVPGVAGIGGLGDVIEAEATLRLTLVPEPGSLALLTLGLWGIWAKRNPQGQC